MKILAILHSHECGGAEKHLLLLAEELRRMGHEVIWAGPRRSWLGDKLDSRGYRILNVPLCGLCDLYSMLAIVIFARMNGVSLIHGHLVRGAFYARVAGFIARLPSIATAHATTSYKRFSRSGYTIAVAKAVRDILISRGFSADKVVTIANGVADTRMTEGVREAVRQELGLRDDVVALVQVGRFIRDKGQDILVEALAGLSKANIRTFFVGKTSGRWHAFVENEVRKRGLSDRISFLGHRDDVARILAGMDMFVMPSRREAFPLGLLEAASARLPIVAAAVGGIPEFITDGDNGCLCIPDDVPSLQHAIQRVLLMESSEMVHLGHRARQTYEAQYTARDMAEKTLALYNEALRT